MQHIPYYGIIPFSYDSIKTCFQNSEYIRENLFRRMELFQLPIVNSGDLNLNLKACTFKFLIVLLLCYNTLFYFNLYLYLHILYKLILSVDIVELSHLQLSFSVSLYYSKIKSEFFFAFSFWFKHRFSWSK